jgi:hypothetical protein
MRRAYLNKPLPALPPEARGTLQHIRDRLRRRRRAMVRCRSFMQTPHYPTFDDVCVSRCRPLCPLLC